MLMRVGSAPGLGSFCYRRSSRGDRMVRASEEPGALKPLMRGEHDSTVVKSVPISLTQSLASTQERFTG